jgi:hypothetical protein
MDFIQFTPIFTFRNWLMSNLYEGPPIHLRPDYVDAFDEERMKTICGGRFSLYKDMYDRLNEILKIKRNSPSHSTDIFFSHLIFMAKCHKN